MSERATSGPKHERPILVLGCPRSGTTLLRLMLNAHPRIAIPPETRFALPTYFERTKFGDLTQAANRRKLAEFLTGKPALRWSDHDTDRDATVQAILDAPPTVGSALAAVYEQYAARFDKPRWGDKLPTYIEHVRPLLEMFPDAHLVHVLRDGRDCVGSLKRQEWSKRSTPDAIGVWNRAIDYGRKARTSVPAAQWHEVRYEELVSDPEGRLKELCAFLEEDFVPDMLEPAKVGAKVMPSRKAFHGMLSGSVTTTSIGGWEKHLEPWESNLMHVVSGKRLRAEGYEVPKTTRPAPKLIAAHVKAELRDRRSRNLAELKDRKLRRDEVKRGVSVAQVPQT
ncbi:sulfotransferase [Sporichthya sp.]|uniref:sulfotransferase family protein n=1 Tax=Sporichthya sp. TaxID=65475 RepID=UPI001803A18A|nr:sulfotransferase [Sporichthya sp.]MBA3743519.1 sulfotransferase [Sporichthya sp.]